MKAKKVLGLAMAAAMTVTLFAGCSSGSGSSSSSSAASSSSSSESSSSSSAASSSSSAASGSAKYGMVTDTGGVNDQSFNQGAWEGLEKFGKDNTDVEVKYLESKQASDYTPNLNQFSTNGYGLVWGIGYEMADAVSAAAKAYPDINYGIVDDVISPTPDNLTCVTFRAQESSFVVGYIAALKTKTNNVGFLGGMKGTVIDGFDYGFQAGVAYGAKQLGKKITVQDQYANSFTDASLGTSIAKSMYAKGADIIFAAAGNVGQGMISEAKAEGKYCIGVDMDQSGLAPDNVITSAMKNVNAAVYDISKQFKAGQKIGGKTLNFGLKEGGVGIPDTAQSKKLLGNDVYQKAVTLEGQIISGKITPPADQASFKTYVASLG